MAPFTRITRLPAGYVLLSAALLALIALLGSAPSSALAQSGGSAVWD